MDRNFETEILNNAISIGDEIIEKAIIDSNGIHWRTVTSVTQCRDVITGYSETLYSGVSGILLFYIELYKSTRRVNYLELINTSAQWLINYCHTNQPLHGFYSGRMGTVFTLLEIAEIERKEFYQQKALEIASLFKNITNPPVYSYNLNNGLAGTILGLLYLHRKTGDKWILDSIWEGVAYLLKNAKSSGVGLYWDMHYNDSTSKSTKPLCSMPLGPSGVALLFVYLSTYFNNADYGYIAEQALDYENQYADADSKSWPDFRMNTSDENRKKLRKLYENRSYSGFVSNTENLSWMYGAAGLYFTRLQASRFLSGKNSHKELKMVMEKILSNDSYERLPNDTIATGKAGFALLLLELSRTEQDDFYYKKAIAIAEETIAQRKLKKFYQIGFDVPAAYEDDSLFMGNAGIGYFYLKLINKEAPAVLFPSLLQPAGVFATSKCSQFRKENAINTIINAWYPHSLSIIGRKVLSGNGSLDSVRLKHAVRLEIERVIHQTANSSLQDAYKYESLKQTYQEMVAENYCLFTLSTEFELLRSKNLLGSISRVDLMGKTLKLNPYVRLADYNWDWSNSASLTAPEPKETYFVYGPDESEYLSSRLHNIVLSYFITPQKAESVFKVIIEEKHVNTANGEKHKSSFLNLLVSFIEAGVLTYVNTPVIGSNFSFLFKQMSERHKN